MAFVAVKPCRFAGQSFRIGESVPDEVIHPGAVRNLIKMGLIAEAGATANEPTEAKPQTETVSTINITIHAEEGDLILAPTPEGLQAIFDVLSSKAADAEGIIEGITDGDALIILDVSDSRKTIKELCRNRAKEISEPLEEEESEGEL